MRGQKMTIDEFVTNMKQKATGDLLEVSGTGKLSTTKEHIMMIQSTIFIPPRTKS